MKKEYIKPEIEYVSFDVEEKLLGDILDDEEFEMGTSEMPEGML